MAAKSSSAVRMLSVIQLRRTEMIALLQKELLYAMRHLRLYRW